MDDYSDVIVCQGPPICLLQDDEAVEAQVAGCTLCRRIRVHADGREEEFQAKAN